MFDQPGDFSADRLGLNARWIVVNSDHWAILERILDVSSTCAYTDEIEQRGFRQSYFSCDADCGPVMIVNKVISLHLDHI
jgi:hypothetical protein